MRSADARSTPIPRGGQPAWRGLAAAVLWLWGLLGWQAPLLVALGGLLLLGAYQIERPIVVNVGGAHETPFVHNFHAPEVADDGRTSYRWTHATSFVPLRGIGGERDRRVTLRLRSGRPAGTTHPATIVVNGVEVGRLDVGAEWQAHQLEVRGAAGAAHGLLVELRTRAERLPASGGRAVGVQVDAVRVETIDGRRTVPAWDTFGVLLLAIAAFYLIAWRALRVARQPGPATARERSLAAACGLVGALALAWLVVAARPYIAAYDRGLLAILLGALAALFLPRPLMRLGARLGLAIRRGEAAALCGILALGIVVKLGGLFYPDTVVIDLPWHVKWERTLLRGDFAALYFPSELSSGPREWGAGVRIPKSPLYYLAMAPVALLPLATGTGLKLAAGLLDLALIFFAYAILKRVGRGGAGVVAALLYTLTPLSYLILSYGSYPTLLAQFLAVLTFALVLFAGDRLDRPPLFGAFVLLLALGLLAYPVVAVFDLCVLAGFGLWRWRGAADAREARRALLLPIGGLLAAVLAFVAYYAQYARVTLASVRTITGEGERARGGLEGGLLGAPWHIATVAAKNVAVGNLLVLLPLAVAGVVLLGRDAREGEERRTWQFLLVWLLIMPAFIPVDAYVELLLKPLFYTMLPVALFGGVAVAWLWQRGRAGQVAAVLCCALIAAQAWWLWFGRIAYAGQPPG